LGAAYWRCVLIREYGIFTSIDACESGSGCSCTVASSGADDRFRAASAVTKPTMKTSPDTLWIS